MKFHKERPINSIHATAHGEGADTVILITNINARDEKIHTIYFDLEELEGFISLLQRVRKEALDRSSLE